MADVKISELPAGTASTDDTLVVVDGGVTKKITVAGVTALTTKSDVGLANVDNTTDALKPVSTAGQTALDLKVSKDSDTGAASMPTGTTAQRPTGAVGMFRHNSTLDQFEGYNDGAWGALAGGGELSKITYEYIATAGQTSFTGSDLNSNTLSYTVGSIIVSYGGLDLAFSDYTATNGSSITLADGALVGKIVRIVAFTTFAVADTYTQSQADVLLAAKATTTEVALKAPIASPSFTGGIGVTGSLEVSDTQTFIYIKETDVANKHTRFMQSAGSFYISTVNDDNSLVSGSIGINNTTNDVTLQNGSLIVAGSGGVYLGGTGAANKLDDYEEGTWTPIDSSGAGLTLSVSGANYVKVGTLCHVSVYLNFPNNGNGLGVRLGGLPFTAKNNQNYSYLMGRSTIGGIMLQVDNNSTTFDMRPADSDSGVTNAQIANSHILFSGTYITA